MHTIKKIITHFQLFLQKSNYLFRRPNQPNKLACVEFGFCRAKRHGKEANREL